MEAFLGSWKAGPGDYENAEEYLKALNQPGLAEGYKNGVELVFAKDGDNYTLVHILGGVPSMKEVLHADGKVTFESDKIPAELVKVTHKMDGANLVVEGTVAGGETKSVCSIEGGKMVTTTTTAGVSMKATYTKA